MAISDRWAIQRVFTADLFDLTNGMNIGHMSDLKESTFKQEATLVWVQGGPGNPKLLGFDHSKMASFAIKSAYFSSNVMGAQLGATPVTGTNANLVWTDTLTVTTSATPTATATYTPVGTAGSEIKYAYVLNTDGSLGTQYTQMVGTATTGKFSVSGKTITFAFADAGALPTGTQIAVFYNATAASDTVTVSSYTDLFAKNVKVVLNSLVRDLCTGLDYKAQIILYKAKASNNFTFTLTADGGPSVQDMELEALKSCSSTKLWDLIVYTTAS